MANKSLSQLSSGLALAGSELLFMSQSQTSGGGLQSVTTTPSDILAYVSSGFSDKFSTLSVVSSGFSQVSSGLSSISSGLSNLNVSVASSLSNTNSSLSALSTNLSNVSSGFSNINSSISSVSSGLSNVSTGLSNINSSVSAISSGLRTVTLNLQSGAYTFALTDAATVSNDTIVRSTSTSAQTFTIPLNSTIAFPVGSQLFAEQDNTGTLTVAGASGVTLTPSPITARARYSILAIIKVATDTWLIGGDMT